MSCFKFRLGDSVRLKTWSHGEPTGEVKEITGMSNLTGQNLYVVEGEQDLIHEDLLSKYDESGS